MKLFKLMLAVAGPTALLGVLGATASAGRLSLSSQTFRSTLGMRVSGGFGTTEGCLLTLEGSLHARTLVKAARTLIGYISSAIAGGICTVLPATLPWHVRYLSFSGVLPNIGSIQTDFTGIALQLRILGVVCLLSGSTFSLAFNREAGGRLTTAHVGGSGMADCGASLTLSGSSSSLTVPNLPTSITVTLI